MKFIFIDFFFVSAVWSSIQAGSDIQALRAHYDAALKIPDAKKRFIALGAIIKEVTLINTQNRSKDLAELIAQCRAAQKATGYKPWKKWAFGGSVATAAALMAVVAVRHMKDDKKESEPKLKDRKPSLEIVTPLASPIDLPTTPVLRMNNESLAKDLRIFLDQREAAKLLKTASLGIGAPVTVFGLGTDSSSTDALLDPDHKDSDVSVQAVSVESVVALASELRVQEVRLVDDIIDFVKWSMNAYCFDKLKVTLEGVLSILVSQHDLLYFPHLISGCTVTKNVECGICLEEDREEGYVFCDYRNRYQSVCNMCWSQALSRGFSVKSIIADIIPSYTNLKCTSQDSLSKLNKKIINSIRFIELLHKGLSHPFYRVMMNIQSCDCNGNEKKASGKVVMCYHCGRYRDLRNSGLLSIENCLKEIMYLGGQERTAQKSHIANNLASEFGFML